MRSLRAFVGIVGVASLVGCGTPRGIGDPDDTGAQAADLREAIDGYEAWSNPPSWPGVQPSDSVHGAYVQIFWNEVAEGALDAPMPDGVCVLPAGSAIVKEGYDDADGSAVIAITAMWKADAEWSWARLAPDGTVETIGQPDGCVDCHAAGDDGVLGESW